MDGDQRGSRNSGLVEKRTEGGEVKDGEAVKGGKGN